MKVIFDIKDHKREALADFSAFTKIVALVASHFNVTLSDIEGHDRHWEFVWPRWVAISLVRKHTKLSRNKIALLFNRDHVSISNALHRLKDRLETNRPDAATFATLDRQVGRDVPIAPATQAI